MRRCNYELSRVMGMRRWLTVMNATVVRSIMAGEIYAFCAAFGHAYIVKHDLERIFCCQISLSMFTDSKQKFDVITRASHTTQKRLLIDIAPIRVCGVQTHRLEGPMPSNWRIRGKKES